MADARRGPIAITGASGRVGTLLGERLAQHPNEVRPLSLGDDPGAGIRGAETVVHLAGTLQPKASNTYESANADMTEAVCDAAAGAGVDRITFRCHSTRSCAPSTPGPPASAHPAPAARVVARLSPSLTPSLMDLPARQRPPPATRGTSGRPSAPCRPGSATCGSATSRAGRTSP